MTIEIEYLRGRARSFRRRAEWMLDGPDRDRLLARAREYELKASELGQAITA
jgi:hypothetical protein